MTERHAPVAERIRALGTQRSGAGERISVVIQDRPSTVVGMTVTDLASVSQTSVGSVVRFCQELGFRGFQDLKIQLAGDLSATRQPGTDSGPLPRRILNETATAIADAAAAIDLVMFNRAVEFLDSAGRVLVAGVGTSQPIAADAAYRLQLAGVSAVTMADGHGQHVAAALLTPSDVCLTVSHTGQTRETLMATEAARSAGARTIGLSSFARSPLSQVCDVMLVAGSTETGYRVEAMTSRFVHLAVIDALFVALAERNPARAERAHNTALEAVAAHRL